jgi:hypothetical protein
MKKVFHGTYAGVGSAIKVGLGFRPDYVRLQNIDQAEQELIEWNRHMTRAATGAGGICRALLNGSSAAGFVALAANAGVRWYDGGDLIQTSASTVKVALSFADGDYSGDQRAKGSGGAIIAFELDTAANRTGHFNAPLNTAYAGVGSPVIIQGQIHYIVALTNSGSAADEVTLDRNPSGIGRGGVDRQYRVDRIGYRWDVANAPVGLSMPQGIEILDTTYCNVSGQICLIEAGTFE